MMPKSKLLFKLQQGRPSGGSAPQALKLLGAAQRHPLSYSLHFILTPFVSFQFKKNQTYFSEVIFI